MRRTLFAGLTVLDPDEPLFVDGSSFTSRNPQVIDHLLEVGAVTHRHDAHPALATPVDAPSATMGAGGSIPADTTLYIGYTLQDFSNGETTLSPVTIVTTPSPIPSPDTGPTAVVDYTAGTLRSDTFYYAVTLTDGVGGETLVGPSVAAEREPGFPLGRVTISGLQSLMATGSAAGWRLYRATGGGQLDYLTQGSADVFVDDGSVPCDCNVRPPKRNRTNANNSVDVVVPSAALASAYSLYISPPGDFISPCLIDTLSIDDANETLPITLLDLQPGAPPDVSTSKPGASKINPDTDILDWPWKRSVETVGDLPGIAEPGDVRLVRETGEIWYVDDGGSWVMVAGGSDGGGGDPGGGGGASAERQTVTVNQGEFNFGDVPTGRSVDGKSLGAAFHLLGITTAGPLRVRLYTTAAARDADVARPIETARTGVEGCHFDQVIDGEQTITPDVVCSNMEYPVNNYTPMRIDGVDGTYIAPSSIYFHTRKIEDATPTLLEDLTPTPLVDGEPVTKLTVSGDPSTAEATAAAGGLAGFAPHRNDVIKSYSFTFTREESGLTSMRLSPGHKYAVLRIYDHPTWGTTLLENPASGALAYAQADGEGETPAEIVDTFLNAGTYQAVVTIDCRYPGYPREFESTEFTLTPEFA